MFDKPGQKGPTNREHGPVMVATELPKIERTVLDTAGRLLLLLSRLHLDDEQRLMAKDLAGRITDWPDFRARALAHFILPLTYRHFRELDLPELDEQEMERFRQESLGVVTHSLLVAAVQRSLVGELLQPLGIPFVLIKGYALSSRYYPEPAARFCRDIDVLVPGKALVGLVEKALSSGYVLAYGPGPWSRRDIQAMARYQPEITLLSPRGIPVEFHSRLDKSGLILDTHDLIRSPEIVEINGVEVPMLSTTDHFVYLCLHHTRHLWSHLHWLTDLDALMSDDGFDSEAVIVRALDFKLESTVRACVALHHDLAGPEPGAKVSHDSPEADLVNFCLHHIMHGPNAEREIRKNRPYSDFSFGWQAQDNARIRSGWRQQLRLAQPQLEDYQRLPLPIWMHWLYFLTRPVTGIWRRLNRWRQGRL